LNYGDKLRQDIGLQKWNMIQIQLIKKIKDTLEKASHSIEQKLYIFGFLFKKFVDEHKKIPTFEEMFNLLENVGFFISFDNNQIIQNIKSIYKVDDNNSDWINLKKFIGESCFLIKKYQSVYL